MSLHLWISFGENLGNTFDAALSMAILQSPNFKVLTLEMSSSYNGETKYDIVNTIASLLRTLAESDHHLSDLYIYFNCDAPNPFVGKGNALKKIFTTYPNPHLISITIHLMGFEYDQDDAISVASVCFPNARMIVLNEVNICR
jgi:hypothetical protein